MWDNLNRISWPYLRAKLEFLPAGLLLASGLALTSPHDHNVHTITLIILAVSFSVSVLVYRPILQAANFPHIVSFLALWCVLHRVPGYTRALNITDEKLLKEEVVSCLREFAVMTACVCFAIAMGVPPPMGEPPQGLVDVEAAYIPTRTTQTLAAHVGVWRPSNLGSSSSPVNSDHASNVGSLLFRCYGPPSLYSGNSESEISLSSSSDRVNPVLEMDVSQIIARMIPPDSVRDEDASTEVQPDIYDRQ